MPRIELDKDAVETLSRLLTRHFKTELGFELEPFDARDLVDFLSKSLGPYYYNQGLQDAQVVIKGRLDSIVEAIDAIEHPVHR